MEVEKEGQPWGNVGVSLGLRTMLILFLQLMRCSHHCWLMILNQD